MTEAVDQVTAATAAPRRWVILASLSTAMAISFADRYVLAMLVQPIKADLAMSDTAMGLLNGFAFSAFYAIFGLAIARASDRGSARYIIVASLVVWSVMTALCGAAHSFVQLLLARFGVGAGEAGVAPSSHAILTRQFPASQRSTALAIFSAGGPAGILVAFAVSGALDAHVGWRWTFVVMGLPGLLLALIVLPTLRGIDRPTPLVGDRARPNQANLAVTLRLLFVSAQFRYLLLALSGLVFLAFGHTQWLPAYLERNFGVPRSTLGPLLALTQGVGLLIGMAMGGFLTDFLGARDARWPLRVVIMSMVAAMPFTLAIYTSPNLAVACFCSGLAAFLVSLPSGALWSMVQGVLPLHFRATGAATVMMASSLIGLGVGPFVVGMASDMLATTAGDQSLRWALLLTTGACSVLTSIALWGLRRSRDAT